MAWTFELLAGPMTITEGPAWDGSGLLFTAIHQNRILRWDPAARSITTVYTDTSGTNGLLFAPDGRLFACEGGGGQDGLLRHERQEDDPRQRVRGEAAQRPE